MSQRIQREAPGVAVQVEHAAPLAVCGHGAAVGALVEVEAGLLAGLQVDQVAQVVLDDLNRPVQNRADDLFLAGPQPFTRRNSALGADDDPLRLGAFGESQQEQLATVVERETGELRHEPLAVTIDGQP